MSGTAPARDWQERIDGLLALAEAHGRRFDTAALRGDLTMMDVELDNLGDISRRLRVEVEGRVLGHRAVGTGGPT